MMQVKLKLGSKQYSLKVTWAASVLITQEVGDPIRIFEEIGKAGLYAEQGLHYEPRIQLGLMEFNRIVRIVLNDNGHDLSEDDLGALMIEGGATLAVNACAMEILSAIVDPSSLKKDTKPAKKGKPPTG